MPSECKVVCKIHTVAAEILQLIRLGGHLSLHGLARVADALLDVTCLLVNLRTVEQRLGEIPLDNVKVDASYNLSLLSVAFCVSCLF